MKKKLPYIHWIDVRSHRLTFNFDTPYSTYADRSTYSWRVHIYIYNLSNIISLYSNCQGSAENWTHARCEYDHIFLFYIFSSNAFSYILNFDWLCCQNLHAANILRIYIYIFPKNIRTEDAGGGGGGVGLLAFFTVWELCLPQGRWHRNIHAFLPRVHMASTSLWTEPSIFSEID